VNRRILVVNDNRAQLELLSELLSGAGAVVHQAADGAEALVAARTSRPDAIVTDVEMPILDGIALCRAIRADAELCDLPVVLVSALDDVSKVEADGFAAGADDYLALPCDPARLVESVARLARPVVLKPEPADPNLGAAGGTETILVVEDAQDVRALVQRMLQRAGYVVLTAVNGHAAVRVATAHRGRLDLVIADVVMPVKGGPAAARHLRARHPELRLLYMSGYPAVSIVHRGVLDPGVALLEKPFTFAGLLRTVREVLDGVAMATEEPEDS
jgi:CheY-like chemotaxis protein